MEEKREGLKAGAIAFLAKPVEKEALDAAFARISVLHRHGSEIAPRLEDNEAQRQSIVELIAHDDVEITAVASAEEARNKLRRSTLTAWWLDLGLRSGGMSGIRTYSRG